MRTVFASPFARDVTVVYGGKRVSARAFLQPLALSEPVEPEITPAGVVDTRRYLAIVEPVALGRGAEIQTADAVYRVLRCNDFGGHVECVLATEAGDGDA